MSGNNDKNTEVEILAREAAMKLARALARRQARMDADNAASET